MSNQNLKILIAPNSFKECADSVEVSELIKTSLYRLLPGEIKSQIDFRLRPISDGGDGFISVCQLVFGAELLHFEISYPYNNQKFFCPVGYVQNTKTIFIESAEVIGLKMIPDEFRKPMLLSSKGLGELLLQLYDSAESGIMEIDKVVIGVGGTGTNDLGMGMMQVFGLEFYDKKDNPLEILPKNFSLVEKVVVPEVQFPFRIEMIIDVENPLLGIDGASLLFSEQKGATDEESKTMEKGFAHLLDELEVDNKTLEGLSGSGGGIAAAMKLFFNSEEKFADKFIREDLKIRPENTDINMVITGEGKLDNQTLMNKGAFIVVNEFAKQNIPINFLCGVSEGDLPEIENMKVLEISEYFDSVEESIKKIEKGIESACRRICKDIIQQFAKKV
jgi:glycerate 2-kinase